MKGALTLVARELRAWFDSAMAYVVAIGFLLVTSSLFVLDFWIVDQVSMRSYFEWLSWTICFLVPAITMRSWAEERRGATHELLLTLPLSRQALVVGKFLGAYAFFVFAVAGSFVVPILLATLATEGLGPDWGRIAAGYLGVLLAGAMLCGVGVFVSNLCRDQVVAFIVTFVVVLGLKLVGFAPIASQLDSAVGGLGTFLRESVSWNEPLGRFVRGLVDFGDVLFFLAWTALFLFLDATTVESRTRPKARLVHAGGVALGVVVAILLGGVLLPLGPRLDWTADDLYTVSPAAAQVLGNVPEDRPVRVKLYFSPKDDMPAALVNLERDVVEKLEELQRVSDDRLLVDVVHLHADDAILRSIQDARGGGDDADRGRVETELVQEGVVPFQVATGGLTGTETKVIYSALTLTHGAERKEIIPQVLPSSLATLERDIVTRVHRLVQGDRPVVGLLAPIQSANIPPQQLQLMSQLGIPLDSIARDQDDYRLVASLLRQNDQYDVRRLRPDAEQPLPDDLDTLVVIRPEDLSERHAWEISRFLSRGGSVVLAAQAYDALLRSTGRGIAVELARQGTGLEDLLGRIGVTVPQRLVMGADPFPLTYSTGYLGGQVTAKFPWVFRLDASNFDTESPLTREVGSFVLVDSAAPVVLDDEALAAAGLQSSVLLRTGPSAWTRDVPDGFAAPELLDEQPGTGPIDLAVRLDGTFPAPDEPPPPWPSAELEDDEAPEEDGEAAPASLVLLGTAASLDDTRAVDPSGDLSWAAALVRNAVDALSLDEVLLGLRVREPISRPIREVDRSEILVYQVAFIGLGPALLLVLGLVRLARRRQRMARPFRPLASGGEA